MTPVRTWRIAPLALILAAGLVTSCGDRSKTSGSEAGAEAGPAEFERGPHNGRLLRDGDFSLEVTLYEEGPAPLFRLYPYLKNKPMDPRQVQVSIALTRLGPKIDRFTFTPEADYLASPAVVFEPHSFDVSIAATRGGARSTWSYQSYEGRTIIKAEAARAGGVRTERAGAAVLGETLPLTGRVEITPEGQSEVFARYPGMPAGKKLLSVNRGPSARCARA